MPHHFDEYRVDTPRLALSVRDHAGAEPAILALHGLASNARWWDLVADRLVPAHRVIAVDLPGHGLSDRPDTGYDFDTVSADLEGLLAGAAPSAAGRGRRTQLGRDRRARRSPSTIPS